MHGWSTSNPISPQHHETQRKIVQNATMASLTPSNITPEAFNEVLSRYPAAVPKKLRDLDTLRFSTLPARVVERRAEHHGNAWLELGEVISLVEWKL
jgi:hypothetical protein